MSSTSEMYSPGTELMYYIGGKVHPSFADTIHPATSVTVITDGNVFITAGIGAGTIMKYVDWLILAGGKPIPSSTPIPKLPMQNPLAIGAKIKWVLNEETYRVAIQTANGLLQVKSVTDGGAEVHDDACDCNRCIYSTNIRLPLKTTLFANEDEWRASLPSGGVITSTMPGPRSKGEQLAEAYNPYTDGRDKLREYMRRFNIRSKVVEDETGVFIKTRGTARLRAEICGTHFEVALKGDKIDTDIALRYEGVHARAPARLFINIWHITEFYGEKPTFYVLHYGRRIQLPPIC